jgi:hypothetical protein
MLRLSRSYEINDLVDRVDGGDFLRRANYGLNAFINKQDTLELL